jgi:hypothetical protein
VLDSIDERTVYKDQTHVPASHVSRPSCHFGMRQLIYEVRGRKTYIVYYQLSAAILCGDVILSLEPYSGPFLLDWLAWNGNMGFVLSRT